MYNVIKIFLMKCKKQGGCFKTEGRERASECRSSGQTVRKGSYISTEKTRTGTTGGTLRCSYIRTPQCSSAPPMLQHPNAPPMLQRANAPPTRQRSTNMP